MYKLWPAAVLFALPGLVQAGGIPGEAEPDTVYVDGASAPVNADSASIGTVYAEQFENRPLSRPGELLEVVPGLIVTQHSGEGKANQYFLRGFNLDHGTDFATRIDGMPVNMPTHAHGQGYSDANFLIAETVQAIEYRKGPYYAQYGDFSAAGAADIRLRDQLAAPRLDLSLGAHDYARAVALGSSELLSGNLFAALEAQHYNGPWQHSEHFNKLNGLLRYSQQDARGSWHLSAMGYDARWDSSDQIPQRAVTQGLISRLGCLDCSDGGKTYRYSLSGDLDRALGAGRWRASAYAIAYQLDLFSNFTYFLNDPLNGDQFEQYDRRGVYGGQTTYLLPALSLAGLPLRGELGLQTRYDDISPVALYHTQARQRLNTISRNEVRQWSKALYAQGTLRLAPWLQATAGLRYDHYDFSVHSDLPANSGAARDQIFSPKLSLAFGPFDKTELFVNLGRGFHSNDARGTTQTIDPNDGSAVSAVTPLVATRGLDLGLRSLAFESLQYSATLFWLDIDSELTFGGDSNSTEPNRPSRRYGLELAAYWTPLSHLLIDADAAYTRARFRDQASEGNYIPEAATSVAALGASYDDPERWFGALRLRYFGPRPLIEDDSVRSKATAVVNLDAGYHLSRKARLALQVLNLFNSRDHDIDYYFASRLPGEASDGVEDIHFHPVEPINLRLLLSYSL